MASIEERARTHAALGEVHRLAIVDALELGDHTPSELQALTGLSSNLLAFHLEVLEDAGLIARLRSQGDGRRRYVTRTGVDPVAPLASTIPAGAGSVLFVCTHNAARSQLAAALWRQRTGREAASAGTTPADRIHPAALEVARRHGLALARSRPRGYDDVDLPPDLVVSVCDRARERGVPFPAPRLHWSVPDPVGGPVAGFERAYEEIARRVDRLAQVLAA